MVQNEYKVIGVMSGTSLDGIDLIYVKFVFENTWKFQIIHAETVPYNEFWFDKLRNLVRFSFNQIKELDRHYTAYLSEKIGEFILKFNLKSIDAVCSHGHTALHQPEKGITYQIGNLPEMAAILKQTIVCNFRVQDVKLGGQGAPLVPIGDKLLFSNYDYCLNLGGFANLSTDIENQRIAYDICPVNIVLNKYVKRLGLDFDDEGKLASSGTIHNELLLKLNQITFYKSSYPKSLGLEWVEKNIFPLIDMYNLESKDVLKTFVEHIAIQITKEISLKTPATVFVTGGGVYNKYLIQRLKTYTQNNILIPSKTIIEFKEALIFGLLGILKLRNEINCLKSVTGASKNHCSGEIFNFKK